MNIAIEVLAYSTVGLSSVLTAVVVAVVAVDVLDDVAVVVVFVVVVVHSPSTRRSPFRGTNPVYHRPDLILPSLTVVHHLSRREKSLSRVILRISTFYLFPFPFPNFVSNEYARN